MSGIVYVSGRVLWAEEGEVGVKDCAFFLEVEEGGEDRTVDLA